MKKKDIIKLLDEIFIPLGFKRKGNYWVSNSDVLCKMVNLQKSNYGNFFYINYGYIIKSIPLDERMHIYHRLAGTNKEEQKDISDLLDLDAVMGSGQRYEKLKNFILTKIVSRMRAINSEEDILSELKKRSHLNDVPLIVKKHFNLSIE
jgi:hypothetical protein